MKKDLTYMFVATMDDGDLHQTVTVEHPNFKQGLVQFRKLAMNIDGTPDYSLHVVNGKCETVYIDTEFKPYEDVKAPKV